MNLTPLHDIITCPIEKVSLEIFDQKKLHIDILREDLNHPEIQGNKLRKLKYNLLEAQKLGIDKILTFGGAFSNHIAAVAAAGKEFGFKTIGVIRGDELAHRPLNPTLDLAQKKGMKLHFVTREDYRNKNNPDFLKQLKTLFGDIFIVPEGGSSPMAIPGVAEMIDDRFFDYDIISVAVGTGGTLAGIVEGLKNQKKVLGFPALKDSEYLHKGICNLTKYQNYEFVTSYHFGGFGKIPNDLITFAKNFYLSTKIMLDPVYTSKMFYGLVDLAKKDFFKPETSILAIHTGGIQGINGVKNKNTI